MKSKSILVMRFSSIGDIIQTTSTLSTIKEYLPNYTIDYLTLDHFKSILKNHKSLNNIYSISKNAKYSHISELILKLSPASSTKISGMTPTSEIDFPEGR